MIALLRALHSAKLEAFLQLDFTKDIRKQTEKCKNAEDNKLRVAVTATLQCSYATFIVYH